MHKNWAIKINGLTGGYKVVSDNTCIYILKIMRIREKERETKVRVRGSENRNQQTVANNRMSSKGWGGGQGRKKV